MNDIVTELEAMNDAWEEAEVQESQKGFYEFVPDKSMLVKFGECSVGHAKKSGNLQAIMPFVALTGPNKGESNVIFRRLGGKDDEEQSMHLGFLKTALTRLGIDISSATEIPKAMVDISGTGADVAYAWNKKHTFLNYYINDTADVSSLESEEGFDWDKGAENSDEVDLDALDREGLITLAEERNVAFDKGFLDSASDDDIRDILEDAVAA